MDVFVARSSLFLFLYLLFYPFNPLVFISSSLIWNISTFLSSISVAQLSLSTYLTGLLLDCCNTETQLRPTLMLNDTNDKNRDSGVSAIESLMLKRGTFDYILLETTGLANPGNIAPIFWLDDELGSSIYLDGIVTVVDARNILHYLDVPTPSGEEGNGGGEDEGGIVTGDSSATIAHLQISHADVVIANKSDMVNGEQLERVKERVHGINGLAKVNVTSHGRVKELEGVLLDLHAYDAEDGTLRALKGGEEKDGKKKGVVDSVSYLLFSLAILLVFYFVRFPTIDPS